MTPPPRVLALLCLLAAAGSTAAADLRIGAAAVNITPPVGIPMAGYYSTRLAEGTHDDLHAKAMVVEQDGVKVAMVALDLVTVARPTVEAARRLISKNTGVP